MHATIIHKVEYVTDKVVFTPIGYTTNTTDINTINSDYDSTLGAWIDTNKSALEAASKNISEFFAGTSYVHVARTEASNTTGLSEITDINSL
jgi:hypothetical protein